MGLLYQSYQLRSALSEIVSLVLFVGRFFVELQRIAFLQVLSGLTTATEPADLNNLIQVR